MFQRNFTNADIDALILRLTPVLRSLIALLAREVASPAPIPHKLTVEQFAWCVERSAYTINEHTRINPKLRAHVQGKRPKLIHPAALALYGVDAALASERLKAMPKEQTKKQTAAAT